jgi:hypothetical protein
MLSWRFEASNDMVHWTLLDTRYHNLHTPDAIDALCKKGGTTTWGIEPHVFHSIGYEGFSAFRLVQIDVNSSGTDAMALSGIEVYGTPTNPELWQF